MKDYKTKLMSKNGHVAMLLARELISCDVGERIRTIGEYTDNFETGRGTVQAALKFLQDEGAISIDSRGRLGTYIVSLDYEKLWAISGFGVIMGVMPLPYSKRYEGLATGLYKSFEKANIPFSLAFMRGAGKRIEALDLGKYDFVITSKLAAHHEMKGFSNIEILYEFGEKSYVGHHKIVFRNNNIEKIKDGMRIGIDPASPDQFLLTKYECEGKKVKYVEVFYNQIIQKLEGNEIDAAIWNEDEIREKSLKLNIMPLQNPRTIEINKMDTIATLVINSNNKELKNVIDKFINMEYIQEIQKKVLNNKMIPAY
ncbi:GntR family transcriptional regulator YhfZ [Anaerosalibacter massiliensis]|uniref:Uncharacterized protein n=1 Tax=Anaerosalibacter massiliensis TaxID=1347392 RepID=A0A9X2MJM9_9FIRM|nr:GntR family transcriptional regulator YhfZ [Anaerosalibacter massiliensis]MCR2044854.1 hypothetical protein [Anaerosalibacter massiliensis]